MLTTFVQSVCSSYHAEAFRGIDQTFANVPLALQSDQIDIQGRDNIGLLIWPGDMRYRVSRQVQKGIGAFLTRGKPVWLYNCGQLYQVDSIPSEDRTWDSCNGINLRHLCSIVRVNLANEISKELLKQNVASSIKEAGYLQADQKAASLSYVGPGTPSEPGLMKVEIPKVVTGIPAGIDPLSLI